MKTKSTKCDTVIKDENKVLQIPLIDIVREFIFDKKFIETLGSYDFHAEVKDNKIIVRIDNVKNYIKMSLDLQQISISYGYTTWRYIESVKWDVGYTNQVICYPHDTIQMIQFEN